MGTVIKSVTSTNSASQKGVIPLISEAAQKCLENAGVSIDEIGLLINTGLYSENHLNEPAKASLIQNWLNGKYHSLAEEWEEAGNIFSFDLHSGGGGLINAIRVVHNFIASGEIEKGLIVAGDVRPIGISNKWHGFVNGAASLLISNSQGNKGFTSFKTETFTEFINDVESRTDWNTGKFKLVTKYNPDYTEHCIRCACKTIDTFFKEENLNWDHFDCVLTSQSPRKFRQGFAKQTGIANKTISLDSEDENYSSGLLFSLVEIFQSSNFINAKNILLLTVGAGITVSLAHYRNE